MELNMRNMHTFVIHDLVLLERQESYLMPEGMQMKESHKKYINKKRNQYVLTLLQTFSKFTWSFLT